MAGSPQHATLVANVVTTFTFDTDFAEVEVTNVTGTSVVWVTADGSTPVVGATGAHVLPAAVGFVVIRPGTSGNTVVKVLSAGTPTVSARGLS